MTRRPASAWLVVVSATVLALALAPATPASGSTDVHQLPGTPCPVFPARNYWHARVDRLPLEARSDDWLSVMQPMASLHPDFGPSYGEQAVPYGIPVNVVDGGPRVRVTFDYADESDQVRYPLSRATRIEGGWNADGDRHAIVVDARTCLLYETWNTRIRDGRWTAGSGAVWDLRSNRLRPDGWTSADAAGLPILPGLLRYDEVMAGHVDHAIRFTTPITRRAYVWPARHQAGATDDPRYPPMGARFRLASVYDVSSYSPQAQVVLRAMKEHGLVLADNGSAWYFQGTADRRWPPRLIEELKRIPASAFEAVDTTGLRP